MKTSISTLAALAAFAFVLAGCSKHDENDGHAHGEAKGAAASAAGKGKDTHGGTGQTLIKLTEEEQKLAGIKVAAATEEEVREQLSVPATVRANQDRIVRVSPRVPGRVVRVAASLGDAVKAGQTLALLDSIELGEAQSAYAQAASQEALARTDFERAERLRAEEIIPLKEHARARAELEKARASLRAAADRLRLLGVAPGRAADGAPSVFPLAAPFAGTVVEKQAVLGDLAQPEKALFTIADLSLVWVEANVFEKDLAKVKLGDGATVTVAAYPGEAFKGRVAYVGSMLDKETRTVLARIEVANRDGRLKPEMFATALIGAGRAGKAIMLPEEAVLLVQGQPTVFVQEHGVFEPRPVELGERMPGRVVIKSGLQAGEEAVVAGGYALKARMLKSQIGEGHAH